MSISDYIIGLAIGVVVALILVIVMHYTVFKNAKMTVYYVITIILFGIGGAAIQRTCFPMNRANAAVPTPQEQIEQITSTIEDTWKNTNGGFTFEQIQKAQDDNECPSAADQIINLKCYDYSSYVVFSFKHGNIYENAVFYKSGNGLILDGVMNMTCDIPGMKWFLAYDTNSFKWIDGRNKEPNYFNETRWYMHNYDNLVSVSRQSAYFIQYDHIRTNWNEASKYILKNAALFAAQNATSNFIKFGDVELIGTNSTGYVKINSFYNYLYDQVKGAGYGATKLIDCTNCLCLPIPSALQSSYPISADKKAEYGDVDYYGVYKCNIAVDLNYVKGNSTILSTTKNESYVETLKKDDNTKDKVVVETLTPNYTFAKVNLSFADTRTSDLTNVDLNRKPVKILFENADLHLKKVVTIDSVEALNKTTTILLNTSTTWSYLVESEGLIFDNYRGNFSVSGKTGSLTFNYYYLDNFTIASVGLNPVGTVDTSVIDLAVNPVRIVLSNSKHTYQFVFDNNTKLNTNLSMLVEMGDYNYTILSKQLVFASVTGTLTITTTDKVMLFNYAVNVTSDALRFNIAMTTDGPITNNIKLSSTAANVALIRENLSSAQVYLVNCVIYDHDGKLVKSFTHTHSASGACSDTWNLSNSLTEGETYTLQLRFTDRDDATITYLSDVTDFTYSSANKYLLTYTAANN